MLLMQKSCVLHCYFLLNQADTFPVSLFAAFAAVRKHECCWLHVVIQLSERAQCVTTSCFLRRLCTEYKFLGHCVCVCVCVLGLL